MNLTDVITGTPVTSEELRAARDRRILKKWELLSGRRRLLPCGIFLKYCRSGESVSFRPCRVSRGTPGIAEKLGRFSIKNTKIW